MLNPAIFREYDIRGIANEELADADVELLGVLLRRTLSATAGGESRSAVTVA